MCFSHYFLSSLHLFFLEWICLTLNMFSLSPFTKILLSPICSSTTCFFFSNLLFSHDTFLTFISTHLFFIVLFWIAMQHSKFILTDVYIYLFFYSVSSDWPCFSGSCFLRICFWKVFTNILSHRIVEVEGIINTT